MAGRSGLILPPGMGVVEGNPDAPPRPNPDDLITFAEAEELAVQIAEHYFAQTQKAVVGTLLQLGLITPKQTAEIVAAQTNGLAQVPASEAVKP